MNEQQNPTQVGRDSVEPSKTLPGEIVSAPIQEERAFELKFWHIVMIVIILGILMWLPAALAWWRVAQPN